jgi:nitrate reductase (cytochrome), electron transfer subunit
MRETEERIRREAPTDLPGIAASRGTQMAMVGIIVLAFVGFVVGIQQESWLASRTPPLQLRGLPLTKEPLEDTHPDVIAATAYRDFDRRQFGPNRQWQSSLAARPTLSELLVTLEPHLPGEGTDRAAVHQAALVERSRRRAFEGAPPVVPHPIDQLQTSSCLACHGEGRDVGQGVFAPAMSHGYLANCTQCHVEQESTEWPSDAVAENHFVGFRGLGGGSRAWLGAPPTVPHPVLMRENCLSCHGPTGLQPLRTSHPLRVNCLQCHAPSAVWDQQPADPMGMLPTVDEDVLSHTEDGL